MIYDRLETTETEVKKGKERTKPIYTIYTLGMADQIKQKNKRQWLLTAFLRDI
jgi:hypothetical protein